MVDKKEKGVRTDDKGTYIEPKNRAPYAPENIHLSKAEFIAKQEKAKEKKKLMAEKEKEVDAELSKPKEEAKVEKKEDKPKGRPKKIEYGDGYINEGISL